MLLSLCVCESWAFGQCGRKIVVLSVRHDCADSDRDRSLIIDFMCAHHVRMCLLLVCGSAYVDHDTANTNIRIIFWDEPIEIDANCAAHICT